MIFVSESGMNYEVSDVLSMLLLFGGGFYLTNKINSLNIPLFKIILIWGLVVSLFCLDTLVSTLVGLVISIIVLLVYVKYMSGMFKSGVILTVIGIIRLLNELNEVPTFVYLLILGITVVFIIFKSMKKYISEPEPLEEEKVKFKKSGKLYCTDCGKEISKDSKFCPYCGHKINK
jgi:hypothetical protein